MTDMNYVLIKRESDINKKHKLFQIDLEELFDKSNNDINISEKTVSGYVCAVVCLYCGLM